MVRAIGRANVAHPRPCDPTSGDPPAGDAHGQVFRYPHHVSAERIPPPLVHVVPRVARATERVLDKVGLTLPQYRVLAFLSLGPSMGVVLAERLAVSPPSISALVEGLVGRGLVTRQRDDADRRKVQLTLTPEGVEGLRDADRVVGERLQELIALLPDDRQKAAVDGLAALDEAFDISRRQRHGT